METGTHYLAINVRFDFRQIKLPTLWAKKYAIVRLKRIRMNKIGKGSLFINRIHHIMRRSTLSEHEVVQIVKNNLHPTIKIYINGEANNSCYSSFEMFSDRVLTWDKKLSQPYDWDKFKSYLMSECKVYSLEMIQDYAMFRTPYYLDTKEFFEQLQKFPQCPSEVKKLESLPPMFFRFKQEKTDDNTSV